MTTATPNTKAVPCPTCQAGVGEPCISLFTETRMGDWHPRRIQDALGLQASMQIPPPQDFAYEIPCPFCDAPAHTLCRVVTGLADHEATLDFPHKTRVEEAQRRQAERQALECNARLQEATTLQLAEPHRKLVVAYDGKGTAVTVELRVERGVVVVDIDTNGDVDVDMYGETLGVIRQGRRQDW